MAIATYRKTLPTFMFILCLAALCLFGLAACTDENAAPSPTQQPAATSTAAPAAPQPTATPPATPAPVGSAGVEFWELDGSSTGRDLIALLTPEEASCLQNELGTRYARMLDAPLAGESGALLEEGGSDAFPLPRCFTVERAASMSLSLFSAAADGFSAETRACMLQLLNDDPDIAEVLGQGQAFIDGPAILKVFVCLTPEEAAAALTPSGEGPPPDTEGLACLMKELEGTSSGERILAVLSGEDASGKGLTVEESADLGRAVEACGIETEFTFPGQEAGDQSTASVDDQANLAGGGSTMSIDDQASLADSFAPQPHVILRVVLAPGGGGPDDWSFASAGGWTQAVSQRESDALRYYEATIWEETGSVHLYAFPNDYDVWYGVFEDLSADDIIAYREQYAVSVHPDMPEANSKERSEFLRRAFEDFASLLVERHPDAEHHLMYSGHGGPGGYLFERQLGPADAGAFLATWTKRLGKPLGVVDMGGPCNKGGYDDLANFCKHARYYVASDLANGGYTLDGTMDGQPLDAETLARYHETDAETQYHRLFASSDTLEEALIGRVDLRRKHYEYSRNNQTRDKVQQASYLYSCAAFNDFSAAFEAFLGETTIADPHYDLYQLMLDQSAEPSLLEKFGNVFAHVVDNRDFFAWDTTANGMISPLERIN